MIDTVASTPTGIFPSSFFQRNIRNLTFVQSELYFLTAVCHFRQVSWRKEEAKPCTCSVYMKNGQNHNLLACETTKSEVWSTLTLHSCIKMFFFCLPGHHSIYYMANERCCEWPPWSVEWISFHWQRHVIYHWQSNCRTISENVCPPRVIVYLFVDDFIRFNWNNYKSNGSLIKKN